MTRPAELYPLKFKEIYKDYIWGGDNLRKIGKQFEAGTTVAESWELSDLDDNISVVREGDLAGTSLRELVAIYGEDICPGTPDGRFPVLIKYLDGQRRASLQLHPTDDFARAHDGPGKRGKHESWYIMEAAADLQAVIGLEKGTTKARLRALLEEGSIEDALNLVPVSAGDFFDITAGTIHCLFEGSIVCEIQETSNTVYRLYDWGRVGADGTPRQLHIEKSLGAALLPTGDDYDELMRRTLVKPERGGDGAAVVLRRGPEYNVDSLQLTRDVEISLEQCHFHIINVLNGQGALRYSNGETDLRRGDTVLVPRPVKAYTIATTGCELLKTFL